MPTLSGIDISSNLKRVYSSLLMLFSCSTAHHSSIVVFSILLASEANSTIPGLCASILPVFLKSFIPRASCFWILLEYLTSI